MNALDKIESQNLASRILKGILKTGRIANTYLFLGAPETGKRYAAIQFAKALNCEKAGCEECPSCIKIGELSHPDIHLIIPEAGKESVSIDQIRDMQREAYLRPFVAKFKVYIIEEAERMPEEAANSLLKIIEEPPKNTIFILATSSPQELLPTIISRCQMVRFKKEFKVGEKIPGIEEKMFLLTEVSGISQIFKEVRNLTSFKGDATGIVDFLGLWYRDVLLLKEKNEESVIFKNRIEQLRDMEKRLPEDFLIRAIGDILWTRHLLARNVSPRLALEALLIKINYRA
jgi:DNA polymerase-3 subunit delta'